MIALLQAPDTNAEPRDEGAFREVFSVARRGLERVQEALTRCTFTSVTTSTLASEYSESAQSKYASATVEAGAAYAGSLALATVLLECAVLEEAAAQLVPSGYLLVFRFVAQLVETLQNDGRVQQNAASDDASEVLLEKLRATFVNAARDLTRLLMRRMIILRVIRVIDNIRV